MHAGHTGFTYEVLLVDDHPIVVSACRLLLEDGGLTTVFDADYLAGYQAFLGTQT